MKNNLKLNKKYNKGSSLPISMFVLLGITISAASMFSTTETNVQMSGNIGLRTIASQANDTAISSAIDWLVANQPNLKDNDSTNGYYSAYPLSDIDYEQESSWIVSKKIQTDSLGNNSRYIIYRLCSQANTAYNGTNSGTYNTCATKTDSSSTNNGNSSGFGGYNFSSQPTLFYKIIVETIGPKGAKITTSTMIGLSAT
jgi:hypothetical protein